MEVQKSQRFFTNHYGTTTIHADVSMVLLRLMPMHRYFINRGVNHSSSMAISKECVIYNSIWLKQI